jgi:hypothetical protein
MQTYDVGDQPTFEHEVRDADGTLTTATVVLTMTDPSGSTSTPSVTTPSTGLYVAIVTLDEAGTWFGVWTASGNVVSVDTFQVSAVDPAPPTYVSLEMFKASLRVNASSADQDRDDLMLQALAAASRQIEEHCGRRFWLDDADTARTYSPRGRTVSTVDGDLLLIDDLGAVPTTVEYGIGGTYTALTTADYLTDPDNATTLRRPITGLIRANSTWPTGSGYRVRVTGRHGWPAIPDQVAQACLIQASRLYKRRLSPEGVFGNEEFGMMRVSRVDPDVQALLAPYVIVGFA